VNGVLEGMKAKHIQMQQMVDSAGLIFGDPAVAVVAPGVVVTPESSVPLLVDQGSDTSSQKMYCWLGRGYIAQYT
jgi:hypothetical protein